MLMLNDARLTMMLKAGLLVAILITAGCATLSKDECRVADWHIIGFEDAGKGHAMDRIGKHRKACASVNIAPDMGRYEQGHREGARHYCTRERGYDEGVSGAAYNGICPLEAVDTFLQAYRTGQERYRLDKHIADIASTVVSIKHRIEEIDADIAYREGEIISPQSGSKSRAEHLNIIRQLRDEMSDLQIELVSLEEQHYQMESEYHHLLNEHRRLGYQ